MKEERMKGKLKAAGLKATLARMAILGSFSDKCHPRSAEDVHGKLKKNDVDLVTVYRTLTSFEEAGILRRVDLRKGAHCYELNEHHHHHMVCDKCGLVEKLAGCSIERLASKVASGSNNFKVVKGHSLEFFGLCRKCAA